MLKDATRRRFEVLAAWSVNRLGRSLQDLIASLQELRAARVDLFLHQQALDTGSPSGRAMFQMLGVFAEFERAIIVERVRAGLARARAEGRTLGRPRITPELEARIRQHRAEGAGIKVIAKALGCGSARCSVSPPKQAKHRPPERLALIGQILSRPLPRVLIS